MIKVDDREQRDHPQVYATLLKNLGHQNVLKQRHEYGDYVWDGATFTLPDGTQKTPTVGVEYATLSDVIGKITSGRYGQQLSGMRLTYDVSILLIEGAIYAAKGTDNLQIFGSPVSFPKSRFEAIRFSTEMHGIRVFNANTRDECAALLIHWYRWWQEDPADHQMFRQREAEIQLDRGDLGPNELPFDVPIGEPIDRAVSTLQSMVHGLGRTRAVAALDKFHDLRTIFMLPESALRTVPGWGPTMAKKFADAATKKWKE